jgi:hypothetical protein
MAEVKVVEVKVVMREVPAFISCQRNEKKKVQES